MWIIFSIIFIVFIILLEKDDNDGDGSGEDSWFFWILLGWLMHQSRHKNKSDDDYFD